MSCQISETSEASDVDNTRDEEGWEDIEPDQENFNYVSLFDNEVFSSIHAMMKYCKEKYGFDFLETRERSQTHNKNSIPSTISKEDFEDKSYMMPFMENDAVLFSLDDLPQISKDLDTFSQCHEKTMTTDPIAERRILELEEELHRVQAQFRDYRATVSRVLDDRWQDRILDLPAVDSKIKDQQENDRQYFNSYSHNDIHETMLKDTVRTDAFRDFIYDNKNLFVGKTVLDVGCGTGILSMFCAKAGAALVIAVDNSEIINKARENIFNNGLDDIITCLWGKIEEVSLPVESVDIIVSEWMGYCLLFEAMLDSVIWARDKYLKPDGLMVPSHMNMWVAPVADPDFTADHVLFWRDVYGFDMKAMQTGVFEEVLVLDMPHHTICGEPFPLHQLNLYTLNLEDIMFTKKWHFILSRDIDSLDGLMVWFDSFFMPTRDIVVPNDIKAEDWFKCGKLGIAFTTGPYGKPTHWRQGVMLIDNRIEPFIPRKIGQELTADLKFTVPEENSRALRISLNWGFNEEPRKSQSWWMR